MARRTRPLRNLIVLVVVFGILGLVIGYLIFGRYSLGNELIPLKDLFFTGGDGVLDTVRATFQDNVVGFSEKRQSIYISGGVGAVVGLILSFVVNRRR